MKIKYIFILFLFFISSILVFDIYTVNNKNMQLKKQRQDYLINLSRDAPIKIAAVWPFPPTSGEDDFKKGILLAIDTLNKGTLLGRKIEVIFKNDEWDVEVAKNIASQLVSDKDIIAVIAHDDINLAIPASITYEYAGMIMISPAVSSPDFTRINFHYIFRNTPNDIIIGRKLAELAKFMNFKKIIVLNSKDLYSEALTKAFTKKALSDGLDIIYSHKFKEDEKEFSKILSEISPRVHKLIDFDVIFIAGNEKNVPGFIKKARKHGIYSPFLTGDLLDTQTILKEGKDMDGTIVATIYNTNLMCNKTQDFIENFRKRYGTVPDTWGAQGYDAVMLLAKAIKNANTLNPKVIAKELKYMNHYKSIFGTYSLDTKGDVRDRDIYFKVVKDAKFHYIQKDRN